MTAIIYKLHPGIVATPGAPATPLATATVSGTVDWACAGETAGKASTVVLGVTPVGATGVPAKYSSAECR